MQSLEERQHPTDNPLRRPLLLLAAIIMVATPILRGPCLAAGSGDPADTASFLAGEFRDRKTSSYDSQRFVSYLSGQLQRLGWKTEIQPYTVWVQASPQEAPKERFVHVTGENLVAYGPGVAPGGPPGAPVDILLVAPYDVLFQDDPGHVSYTARATNLLLDVLSGLSQQAEAGAGQPHPRVAAAFVSGHYQYGSGIQALLEHFQDNGIKVPLCIVVGDIGALSGVPLSLEDSTTASLSRTLWRALEGHGLRPVLIGRGINEALYRQAAGPQPAGFSVESAFDGGSFPGEAWVVSSKGIPVVTVGTPRSSMLPDQESWSPEKTREVASSLEEFVLTQAKSGSWSLLAEGSAVRDCLVAQFLGSPLFIRSALAKWTGLAAGALAVAIALLTRRLGGASLALLGGVTLAFLLGHALRAAFLSGAKGLLPLEDPGLSLFIYCLSSLSILSLGFLRLWRVRTRIAILHECRPSSPASSYASQAGPEGAGTGPGGATPAGRGDWVELWVLATAAAIAVGCSLARSELASPGWAAVAGLSVAVGTGTSVERPWTTWVRKGVSILSLVPLAFFAGSPLNDDAIRAYAAALDGISVESAAFTLSMAALVTCLISSFRFPRPASRRGLRLMGAAEMLIVGLTLGLGLYLPKAASQRLQAQALIKESYGSEARLSVDVTHPLGEFRLFAGTEPGVPGMPVVLVNKSLSENLRLSPSGVPCPFARITMETLRETKTQDAVGKQGNITARFEEAPTYYEITFQDVPLTRSPAQPFELRNVSSILGMDAGLSPASGYSITFTWWMPRGSSQVVPFDVLIPSATTRVDVTASAVYLDRSYSGVSPQTMSPARFLKATTVTFNSAIR